MIKQFVPSEYCLKCKGCCRFKEADSVWVPCLLDEEIQELLDKKIPSAAISRERRLMAVPDPCAEGSICPFLSAQDNECRIYGGRPFECQLYPFIINMRNKKILLTVDLNCPYIEEKINTQEFKEYVEYLAGLLNSAPYLKLFKDNPHILQAYESVGHIMELDI
ncbi:MAG: YkgJ family cysteine cluster protein [Candidatus Omnitrophica bacterium]|nr:YkgJ family cysteine cluster protein [Candidatus Omnitrophota bacterium]